MITDWYIMAYYIPLFTLCTIAIAAKDRAFTFITVLFICAFVASRLTMLAPEESQHMYHVSNNIAVCVGLIYFKRVLFKGHTIISWLVLTYTGMIAMHGLSMGNIISNLNMRYVIELLSVMQLILILVGIDGKRKLFRHIFSSLFNIGIMGGGKALEPFKARMERRKRYASSKGSYQVYMEKDS